jgi:hypothetical protein
MNLAGTIVTLVGLSPTISALSHLPIAPLPTWQRIGDVEKRGKNPEKR